MKLKTCAAVLVLLLALVSRLGAFDGQRKGFILGIGFGGGAFAYDSPFTGFNNATFENNVKIGYAPSNSLEIYYLNIVSYFEERGLSYAGGGALFGLTKYLKPEGRGVFLCGGVGFGYFWEMDLDTFDQSGFGAFGGIGCDLSKHWTIEADLLYTSLDKRAHTFGFRVTLNTLAF